MWPHEDDTVRRAVLSRLDMLDRAADHADPSTLLPLARTELHRLADCWRLLLRTHQVDPDGRCEGCRRPRRWPCQVWRSAHEQLIGEGLPHRARTGPLRNPFRSPATR